MYAPSALMAGSQPLTEVVGAPGVWLTRTEVPLVRSSRKMSESGWERSCPARRRAEGATAGPVVQEDVRVRVGIVLSRDEVLGRAREGDVAAVGADHRIGRVIVRHRGRRCHRVAHQDVGARGPVVEKEIRTRAEGVDQTGDQLAGVARLEGGA